LQVGLRLKFDLVHIAAGRVTGGAKRLLVVTSLTLGSFSRRRNAVRKPEVQIVHFCKPHALPAVDRRQSGRMRRN
jgi:hypothetical protein